MKRCEEPQIAIPPPLDRIRQVLYALRDPGHFHGWICGSEHAQGVFVDQARGLTVFYYDTKAVEAPDVSGVSIPGKKHHLDLNPRLSALVEELILNIKMRFLHHPHPHAANPGESALSPV